MATHIATMAPRQSSDPTNFNEHLTSITVSYLRTEMNSSEQEEVLPEKVSNLVKRRAETVAFKSSE